MALQAPFGAQIRTLALSLYKERSPSRGSAGQWKGRSTFSGQQLRNACQRQAGSQVSGAPGVALRVQAVDESGAERPKGMFSFVTDNESSRSAIQLDTNNVADGNVGQMIASIENKGRDFGRFVESGGFVYFVREIPARGSGPAPVVVLLHGVPTQSWSYVTLMQQLSEKGFHCYSFDWLGFGFSEKPQPGYDFKYTEEAYLEQFSALLNTLGITDPFNLVTQGFLLGGYGLSWALAHPSRLSHLAVLNTPLTPSAPLPSAFAQIRLPFVGEFVCQNAVLPERFIEGGSPYVLENDDADVYRLPYLDSSDPGFALLEVVRKAPLKELAAKIEKGFATGRWSVPTVVAWGEKDKYLASTEATTFAALNPDAIKATVLEGAGHMPQMDWPEKVVDCLNSHFKRGS